MDGRCKDFDYIININITDRVHLVAKIVNLHKSTIKTTPKIYTKTGDKGTSALYTGERRPKSDPIFEALGSTDELSCTIGLANEFATENGHTFTEQLENIQCRLQELGSCIATPTNSANTKKIEKVKFSSNHALNLETWIDEMTKELPPLRNFILPSGGKTSSCLHLARTKCRAAERRLVTVAQDGNIDQNAVIYLNRLSDYLFTVARFAAKREGKPEKIYKQNV
uniref:Corrinoid adenosyltransferase MMAB n=1 Tax=Strigamia maritima TaxID=126957 RepID=T1J2J8_STRMM